MTLKVSKSFSASVSRRSPSKKPPGAKVQPSDQHTLFSRLPNELLLQIIHFLSRPSRHSLRHSCRELYRLPQLTNSATGDMSACERNALLRINEEQSNLAEGKRRCIICDALLPTTFFRSSTAPICKWHDGWQMSRSIPEFLEPGLRSRLLGLQPYLDCYVSLERAYCAHGKDIVNWHIRDCQCGCQICGHFEVQCYVRVSETDGRGLEIDLMDDEQGGLEMQETRRQDNPFGHEEVRRVAVMPLADL